MEIFSYCVPTRVVFGRGALGQLHTLPALGKKALLVTNGGKSYKLNGSFDKLTAELAALGVAYVHFNHIAANPEVQAVEEGAKVGRENGVDFVIALGGGSVMDASKAIAMLIPQPTDSLWDFANSPAGGKKMPTEKPLPWIAITTTLPAPDRRSMQRASSRTPRSMRRLASPAARLQPMQSLIRS